MLHKVLSTGAVVLVLLFTSAAGIKQKITTDKELGQEAFASIGDMMIRVSIAENLPNAFGGADIFGRTRDRGFVEIRYMGLDGAGNPIFRRRDVDIITNETTVTRSGFGTTNLYANRSGSGAVISGVTTRAPNSSVTPLPPDTVEFVLDLSQARVITIRDIRIEVLEATPSGVRFVPQKD